MPVALDTDVNAAALGEGRWRRGAGAGTFAYVTVGTGIGGGVVAGGRLVHGLAHPEIGHLRVPPPPAPTLRGRLPLPRRLPGGPRRRAGARSALGPAAREELAGDDEVWELEARYVALGLVSLVAVVSPEAIVLGGGIGTRAGLRERVGAVVTELLGDYVRHRPSSHQDWARAPA